MTDIVYGTPEKVATMASVWTRDGVWYDKVDAVVADPLAIPPVVGVAAVRATNPSLTEVNSWLSDVSGQVNLALENVGFIMPVEALVSPNAYKAVSLYVVSLVADLCHFKNSSGRFFTEKLIERGITPMTAILKDLEGWASMNERGFIADHVPQQTVPVVRNQIGFRVMGNFPSRNRGGRSI